MQTPPSLTVPVRPARAYQVAVCVVALVAIIFVANYVINTPAVWHFRYQTVVLSGFVMLCVGWLLLGAFRPATGQLRYSQGVWLWRADSGVHLQETEGTLRLALDLQTYVLVQFVPNARSAKLQFSQTHTPWLHLQAQQTDIATWLACRRALTHSKGRSHEELAS
jgi:hypothetical protein